MHATSMPMPEAVCATQVSKDTCQGCVQPLLFFYYSQTSEYRALSKEIFYSKFLFKSLLHVGQNNVLRRLSLGSSNNAY